MADLIPSAQGSLEQDILLVKEARFGRDVRGAIAEGFELLSGAVTNTKEQVTTISTDVDSIKEKMGRVIPGFTSRYEPSSSGINYPVYRWMNGETTYDKITADPSLEGTDIQIGDQIFTYESGSANSFPGRIVFKEYVSGCEIGTVNKYGHSMPCGYKVTTKTTGEIIRLILFDENEEIISADSDGDIEQCGILYDDHYGVKGFKTDPSTKVYIQDLLDRIAALEAKVK